MELKNALRVPDSFLELRESIRYRELTSQERQAGANNRKLSPWMDTGPAGQEDQPVRFDHPPDERRKRA